MIADCTLAESAARFADLIAAGHIIDVALEAPLCHPPRLKACAHCGAGFPLAKAQRFCSRSCAALARPARPVQKRRRRYAPNDALVLRLLEHSPFERAPDGRWWFGTRRINDAAIARLIASGRGEIRGKRLHSKRAEQAR
jgi:hypothetical protein